MEVGNLFTFPRLLRKLLIGAEDIERANLITRACLSVGVREECVWERDRDVLVSVLSPSITMLVLFSVIEM